MLCTNIVLNVKTKTKKNMFCTQHVVNLYFSWNSINNLSSYCGLTDARMRASEKDLPVLEIIFYVPKFCLHFCRTGIRILQEFFFSDLNFGLKNRWLQLIYNFEINDIYDTIYLPVTFDFFIWLQSLIY